MRRLTCVAAVVLMAVGLGAQSGRFPERLPLDQLDVPPPATRVTGDLGSLRAHRVACPSQDLTGAALRRRIVDVTVQEWSFFGHAVLDYTRADVFDRARIRRRGWSLLDREETVRVADSIAGYWTVTPEGSWIIENQNRRWHQFGVASRWRTPWSAAFISWVMCESGLDERDQFRRAVAHHTYIDQAIRARDGTALSAAFTAYDIGAAPIAPGDLLCSGRRPVYRSVAERRRQMGEGARMHCDIVVKLEPDRSRILAIGGNVRATVGLKLLPAEVDAQVGVRPAGGPRPMFVHLKLAADPIALDALDDTPTLRALSCSGRAWPESLRVASIAPPDPAAHC